VRKKTIIAFILGCTVLIPLLFSGGLQLFQQYIKYRASQELESSSLITVSFPLSKVKWMEEGREIMVDGKMFDIKTYTEKNGILIATGVFDEKETRIMELLNNFNDRQQNNLIINLLMLTQTLIVLVFCLLYLSYQKSILKHFCFLVLTNSKTFQQKFYPPPRSFFQQL
jgi:hypothetical protein